MKDDYMGKLLAKFDLEFKQYWVYPGMRVKMSDNAEYVVALTILGDEQAKQLTQPDGGKVWKLFSLVHLKSGVNYATPVMVMSEGSVDIRKLMQTGKYPIDDVVFLSESEPKTGEFQQRTYQVKDQSEYVSSMVVGYQNDK